MMENIIFDTNKSSSINKKVREDGALIKEVDNIEFVINRSEDKTITKSCKSTKSFLRTDPNYGPKSYNKRTKVLRLSQNQNDSNSSPEQCAKCKGSFKTSRALNQHARVCKEKQVIGPKVIDVIFTLRRIFGMLAISIVMKNIFDDMYV